MVRVIRHEQQASSKVVQLEKMHPRAGKCAAVHLSVSGTQPATAMKTLFIILITLVVSQYIYVEHGPDNPLARVAAATAASLRWLVHSVLPMME